MDRVSTHPDHDRVSDPSNRRSSPRVPMEVEVSLQSDSQFFAGLARNVSRGGVFVATVRRLPIGSRVELKLMLPDGDMRARGTVDWLRDESSGAAPGLGIAFEGLDTEAAARVEHFCAMRDPLYHDDE
jgi:uncharacterized protein (TIGR02266 family)